MRDAHVEGDSGRTSNLKGTMPGRARLWVVATAVATFFMARAAFQQNVLGEGRPLDASQHSATADSLSRSFRRATEIVRPSIVEIAAYSPLDPEQNAGQTYDRQDATGVIIDRKGAIATNAHVVEGAIVVTVRLHDGRQFTATEVRTDPWSDIAIIYVSDAGELEEARLADSESLEPGDWVLAIGNSFGMGICSNPGTVSVTNRHIPEKNIPLIQSNAASNPGNSGGALINLRGEVVGISEGAYSLHGGFDGLAFAIPSNVVRRAVSELAQDGVVRWPDLGATFQTLTPELARKVGAPPELGGAILTAMAPKGGAATLGLQVADVITSFRGREVRNAEDLWQLTLLAPVHMPIEVAAMRSGRRLSGRLQLEGRQRDRPKDHGGGNSQYEGVMKLAERRPQSEELYGPATYVNDPLGLELAAAPPPGTPGESVPYPTGAYVANVLPFSAACTQDILPDSVIVQVGSQPIRGLDDFKAAMEKQSADEGVLLLVWCPCRSERFVVLDRQRPQARRHQPHTATRPADPAD